MTTQVVQKSIPIAVTHPQVTETAMISRNQGNSPRCQHAMRMTLMVMRVARTGAAIFAFTSPALRRSDRTPLPLDRTFILHSLHMIPERIIFFPQRGHSCFLIPMSPSRLPYGRDHRHAGGHLDLLHHLCRMHPSREGSRHYLIRVRRECTCGQ